MVVCTKPSYELSWNKRLLYLLRLTSAQQEKLIFSQIYPSIHCLRFVVLLFCFFGDYLLVNFKMWQNERKKCRHIYIKIFRIDFVQCLFGDSHCGQLFHTRTATTWHTIVWCFRLLSRPLADWLYEHCVVHAPSVAAGCNPQFNCEHPVPGHVHPVDGLCRKWRAFVVSDWQRGGKP